MTSAATALLHLLVQRAGEESARIALSDWTSVDWQSLTFAGERHAACFVVSGPDAEELTTRWTAGLGEAEFNLPRGFVAEIRLTGEPRAREDGSMTVSLEALTLND